MLFWIYARPLWQILTVIIILPILCGILFPHSRRWDICFSILAAIVIVSLTIFNRSPDARELVLIPFTSFVWAKTQPELYREMLMNVLLFVPLGLFLPFAFKNNNVLKSVLTAFLLSLFIETIQYIFGLGMAEVDDLMTNTLGAFVGSTSYWISKWSAGERLRHKIYVRENHFPNKNEPRNIRMAIIAYTVLFVAAVVASFFLPVNTENGLSLVIAFFTMIATIGIALLIYSAQKKDENKKTEIRQNNAKVLMAAELESALESLILPPREYSCSFVGGGIKELFIANATELQQVLPPELFRHLSSVVQFVDSFDAESGNYEGYHMILRDWVVPLMCSRYKEYYPLVIDYHDLLNERTFRLMRELNGSDESYKKELYDIPSVLGNDVFSYDPGKKKYTIRDGDAELLNGTFGYREDLDTFGIIDGYEKSAKYEGEFHSGKFDGIGIQYDRAGEKMCEGTWSGGTLIEGCEYNIICMDNGDEENEIIGAYGMLLEEGFFNLNVVDYSISDYCIYDWTVSGKKVTAQ